MRGLSSPLFMVNILANEVAEKIRGFVENLIKDQTDLFLIDIIKKGQNKGGKVIVLLDGDEGVPIDKCVEISRAISRYLDEEIELTEPLIMEVSSPGLDHPLKLKRQYHKNIGKSVRVTLIDQSEVTGILKSSDENTILVETQGTKKKPSEEIEIEFENINKTIVLVSFK